MEESSYSSVLSPSFLNRRNKNDGLKTAGFDVSCSAEEALEKGGERRPS